MMHFLIWYHLYNFKNVKNIHGWVLVTLLYRCFSRFFIVQMVRNCTTHHVSVQILFDKTNLIKGKSILSEHSLITTPLELFQVLSLFTILLIYFVFNCYDIYTLHILRLCICYNVHIISSTASYIWICLVIE